jgi:iron complex outermembrane recepter protein
MSNDSVFGAQSPVVSGNSFEMARAIGASVAAAVATGLLLFTTATVSTPARAEQANTSTSTSDKSKKDKESELQEVVITGSLIPQPASQTETAQPVTVITAEDISAKGFTTVADALQRAAVSTGSVQGAGFSGGFTQGANTISLFGLDPSYTKFLLDGRPIADYPALYNGTENFVSISGIPTLLVEGIDVLPGAQSSIYGSDAIAGVINIRLRKKIDGLEVDARYGATKDGGGDDKRVGVADGFSFGNVNIVVGAQYEKSTPIWGYQRSLTDAFFAGGSTPQTAERDWLVLGTFGQPNGDLYYFEDPADCANVAGQFHNTVHLSTRADRGMYCGTVTSGYYTIGNGTEATQGYLHISDDLTPHVQLFSDVLVDYDKAQFSIGGGFFGTADDSNSIVTGPYYYYLDPNLGDLMNLQQIYSPEEFGGLGNTIDTNTTNSIRATLGVTGDFGSSWKYDVDFTYTENKLGEATHLAFENAINNFYAPIMGPNLGVNAYGTNTYEPDYAAFYKPITPAQYASFSGYATSRSHTEESLLLGELTNAHLFTLHGGDAGLAVVAEGGAQGWEYDPDPRYLDGGTYLYTATAGSGHRSRYALTSEVKLPVLSVLTVDLSGRYDDFVLSDNSVHDTTYDLGLEFRPLQTLLFRGRYGTAFKAPTLADEFQGLSGFYETVTDYYACEQRGYQGPTYAGCPYAQSSVFGTTSGNTALKPINAKVWDLGTVWSPLERSAFSFDFIRWSIDNEVAEQDSNQLMKLDSACLLGQLDINSPTCQVAISEVTRNSSGIATQIYTPKINVAAEHLTVAVVGVDYALPRRSFGTFALDAHYVNILRHGELMFPGDTPIDLLGNPFYSTEFKTKENVAVTWNYARFSTTLYVERYGATPNNEATLTTSGYSVPTAGLLGSWTITNLSGKYEIFPGLTLQANIDNLFNRMPPLDNTYTGIDNQPYNPLNYNPYGRSYYIEVTYAPGKK